MCEERAGLEVVCCTGSRDVVSRVRNGMRVFDRINQAMIVY